MDQDPGFARAAPPGRPAVPLPPGGPVPPVDELVLDLEQGHNNSGEPRRHARHGQRRRRQPIAARPVMAVHVAVTAAALGFWAYQDRSLWFFGDEWDFLVSRGVWRPPTSPAGLLFPHNEHWSTLPLLLWRALFSVFHLTSYWPYLIPLLVVQAVVVHLVWRTCLQSGASPWVATAAAGLLALLGAGSEDFTWAFQIGFVGSVMFGLLALQLVGTGPVAARRRRGADWAACACLVASLMCSTVGDAMVVGAAVLALARLQRASWPVVLGPPVALYAIWFAVVGRTGLADHSDHVTSTVLTAAPGYMLQGLSSALGQTANLASAGGALLVGLVVWLARRAPGLWQRAPVTLALCASVLAFYFLAALGRDVTAVSPAVPRYIYIAMALLTPLVAVVLSGTGRSTVATVGAVCLLAVTAAGNISQVDAALPSHDAQVAQLEHEVLAAARLLGAGVPDVSGPGASPVAPDPNLTAGDMARLQRDGAFGHPHLSALDLVNARALLAMATWTGSETALTAHALFGGHFRYVSSTYSSVHRQGPGCLQFVPSSPAYPLQISLAMPAGTRAASVLTISPPAPPGTVNQLAAFLVPTRGPTSSVPVELAIGGKGRGYFDDDDPGASVVLSWATGTPLTLCGLATGT